MHRRGGGKHAAVRGMDDTLFLSEPSSNLNFDIAVFFNLYRVLFPDRVEIVFGFTQSKCVHARRQTMSGSTLTLLLASPPRGGVYGAKTCVTSHTFRVVPIFKPHTELGAAVGLDEVVREAVEVMAELCKLVEK